MGKALGVGLGVARGRPVASPPNPHVILSLTDNGDSTVRATLAAAGAPADGSFVTITGTKYGGVWPVRVLSTTTFTIPATYTSGDANRTWAAEGAPSIAYRRRNTFTAADNTALTGYTPDAGPAWTAGTGTFKVSGNKLVPNSNADGDVNFQETSQADHVVWTDTVVRHDGSNSNIGTLGPVFRATDASNLLTVILLADSVILYQIAAGTPSLVGTAYTLATADGVSRRVHVVCSGASILVFVDGAKAFEETVTFNQTATKVGIRFGKVGTPPGLASADNLTVPDWLCGFGTLGSGLGFAILRKAALLDATAAPMVVYHHGVGQTHYSLLGDTLHQDILAGLAGAGYRVMISEAHDDNWGALGALDDYYGLFSIFAGAGVNTSKVLFLSVSMGGESGLLGITDARWGGVAGWYGVFPVCSLADLFGGNAGTFAAAIRAAYGIASDGSDYAAKTSGFDPLLRAASDFAGVRMRFVASSADTTVGKANNSDAMSAHVAGQALERQVLRHTGAHGDASAFLPLDVLDFFARC